MPAHRATLPLFGITIFLSAALMFLLQLIFARMVLPLLGGSPAVWNTAMVFYQAVLLAGYGYAHWLGSKFRGATQFKIHSVVLLLAALALPLAIPRGWQPPTEINPVPWLLGMLAYAIGAPFFAISTTSPLLQRWFSMTGHRDAADPYFLYAAGNVGSLLGLLGYPLLIEPRTTLHWQAQAWSIGFGVLVLLAIACGWRTRGGEGDERRVVGSGEVVGKGRRLKWVALAMIPSSLMLSVTSYISSEIAAVPLLWVIPLALYLGSFVIVFARRVLIPVRFCRRVLPFLLVALVIVLATGATTPMVQLAAFHLLVFFCAAMTCHGELAEDRPSPGKLTEFYLWMSVGGVLGGCFNALLAPMLFRGLHEYPVMLVALAAVALPLGNAGRSIPGMALGLVPGLIALAVIFLLPRDLEGNQLRNLATFGIPAFLCYLMSKRSCRFALAIGGVLLASRFAPEQGMKTLFTERSFFGIHRVASDGKFHYLFHGKTVHGIQSLDPVSKKIPLSYYHPGGPLGQIFATRGFDRVAAVGLGAGAAAMYGKPGQDFTFYEIDPAVRRIASDTRFFSYLSESPAKLDFVTGDARLKLAEARGNYDLIILDAYGSDSVPVHLLTREALVVYLGKLAPGGMIAFHISNLHMDLRPVIGNLAADQGLAGLFQEDADFPDDPSNAGRAPSRWALIARDRADLASLEKVALWEVLEADPRTEVWTDGYSSILPLLDFSWK
ncbi:fused MFS/spermidine synthase [Luteolibacter luteus]|uniref:Fused MFS/spermidine synthase n=1 Tax=Luteolibacter luteus TaxID=2728835 RepID=A0A858RNL3_9BACT|nr:fused MFS/spermidine synthase [Luteolibacter luteus]QJE98607.1 fused MFS/spermidine synthase [Luteolibacter luteus]